MSASQRSGSLKTRSEATSTQTASSKKSSVWRRAQISKLRAEQAQRAADAAIKRAQLAAEAQAAQVRETVEQAREEAQRAADQAEIDDLELRLLEEDECNIEEGVSRSVNREEPSTRSALARSESHQIIHPKAGEDDTQRRTRRWIQCLPSGEADLTRVNPALPKVTLDKFSGSPLEWPRWSTLFRTLVHEN